MGCEHGNIAGILGREQAKCNQILYACRGSGSGSLRGGGLMLSLNTTWEK
ncbi:hypothetical protein ES708_11930 [subsurface metagenome]